MPTMTLTEFNQNPSRVVRLLQADADTVIQVTKRGVPLFQIAAIERSDDPLQALIAAGRAQTPANPSRAPLDYGDRTVPAGLDLVADLERERNRLG